MSTTLNVQEIRCPSCNGTLSNFNPKSTTIVCEYCEAVVNITQVLPDRSFNSSNMTAPLLMDSDDFMHTVIHCLAKQNYVHDDVFQKAHFDAPVAYYLPFYVFEGFHQTSWNCETGHTQSKSNNHKSGNETIWTPSGGNVNGNYYFCCLAHHERDIPESLFDFATQYHTAPKELLDDFDPTSLHGENTATVEPTTNRNTVWENAGKPYIETLAYEACLEKVSQYRYRNLETSTICTDNGKETVVYLPFWHVKYSYGEGNYFILMAGFDESVMDGSYPMDPSQQAEVDNCFKTSKKFLLVTGSVCCVLALLCVLKTQSTSYELLCWVTGIFAVISFVIWVVLYRQACADEQEIHDVHRSLRERNMQTMHDQLPQETLEKHKDHLN